MSLPRTLYVPAARGIRHDGIMNAKRVLYIGGTGTISAACVRRSVALGRRRDRPQSRLGTPTAARGRARARRGCAGCRSRARRDRRRRVRRRRGVPRLHARARAAGPRPVRGAHRAVRVHQLGIGLPEAAAAAADHRVDAAAQPVLAVLARQDRVRGPAGRRVPRARLAGHDRAAVAHLRRAADPDDRAAGPTSPGCGRASPS